MIDEPAGDERSGAMALGVGSPSRPFVGRGRELGELHSALDEAAALRGSLRLVTGEPGIGKTRLMHELALAARARGCRIAHGRCWEEGGAPAYWPWIQVLQDCGVELERLLVGGAPNAAASTVLPAATRVRKARPAPDDVDPEDAQLRLFDAVSRIIVDAARERPHVIVLDDIHAADTSSLLLLRFLGERLSESRILVVAAYREREARVRGREGLFGELARTGSRIPVHGLNPSEVATYVATVTGGLPPARAVDRLVEATGGNPFFLGEVLRMPPVASLADFSEDARDPIRRIPDEVRALIRRRVAGLSGEA